MKGARVSADSAAQSEGPARMTLPIAEIGELDAASYVGFILDDAVTHLAARMAAEGQHNPIWVRKNGPANKKGRYSVIAGRHRLRAAKVLGWTEIAAEVRAGPDSDVPTLKRLQLAENLDRRVLRPIERACFIMERWAEAARDLTRSEPTSQQSRAIRARWSVSDKMPDTQTDDREQVDKATADSVGLRSETVRRYRKIFQKIVIELPDLFDRLNSHPFGESFSDMRQIASVKPIDTRRLVAEKLLSSTDWKSMDEVFVASGVRDGAGSRTDPNNPDRVLVNAWRKLKGSQRTASAIFIANEVSGPLARQMFEILEPKVLAKPRGGAA